MEIIKKTKSKKGFIPAVNWIITIILLLWIIELINYSTGHQLNVFGIYPRTLSGLKGIIFSPFLHGSISHLILNTVPFIVLGFFVALNGVNTFIRTSLFIILAEGFGVWLFARPSFHIGASGLIFGYFGYLVGKGIYGKSFSSLLVALITIFLYGGIIWGVLPSSPHISWEGHLFGLISGVFAARIEIRNSVRYSQ